MRNKITYFLLIQIISIIFPISILAQTATPIPNQNENKGNVKSGRIIKCLHNKLDANGNSTSPDLYNFPANGVPPTITKDLEGLFIPNITVYVVACLPSTNGSVCSTGNADNDNYLFYGDDATVNITGINLNIETAKKRANQDTFLQQVKVVFNKNGKESSKTKADSLGKVDITAVITRQSASTPGNYSFFGIEITDSAPVGSGNDGGQKQGVIGFETPDHATTCARITWTVQPANPPAATGQNRDPYGIIFDSQSLEPLPDVKITILNKDKTPLINGIYPGFINGVLTREDGVFNYIVEPGTYFFQVQPPPGFSFKINPNMHQNAKTLYEYSDKVSNTITVKCSFYSPNEAIHEEIDTDSERLKTNPAPDPECRNIPIEPSSTPFTAPPKSMYYSLIRDNSDYVLEGKISHPRSLIELSQNSKVISTMKTGAAGYYIISFPVNSVDQSLPINVTLTKPDYLKIPFVAQLPKILQRFIYQFYSYIKPNVVAAEGFSSTFQVDPIPAYVEGYSYNKTKEIIPNGIVQVRLQGKNSVYYQTNSDEKGYFTIPNDSLPTILPYTIEVISPVNKEVTQYKTYEFAQINKAYLSNNKINLLNGTKNSVNMISNQTNDFKTLQSSKLLSKTNSLTQTPQTNKDKNQTTLSSPLSMKFRTLLPLILILIFLVLIGGIAIFFIIKKKNTDNPQV